MLTKTIKRMFPTKDTAGVHLILTDDDREDLGPGAQIVIEADFTENFTESEGLTAAVRNSIRDKVQEAIDEYKAQKEMFDSDPYKNGRTWIDDETNT
jgi:hypothetical protein